MDAVGEVASLLLETATLQRTRVLDLHHQVDDLGPLIVVYNRAEVVVFELAIHDVTNLVAGQRLLAVVTVGRHLLLDTRNRVVQLLVGVTVFVLVRLRDVTQRVHFVLGSRHLRLVQRATVRSKGGVHARQRTGTINRYRAGNVNVGVSYTSRNRGVPVLVRRDGRNVVCAVVIDDFYVNPATTSFLHQADDHTPDVLVKLSPLGFKYFTSVEPLTVNVS